MECLHHNLPLGLVAERAQCSRVTAMKIEKGDPTVSMGAYLRVLFALQLADDIGLLAKNDPIGRNLQDLELRKRASAKCRPWLRPCGRIWIAMRSRHPSLSVVSPVCRRKAPPTRRSSSKIRGPLCPLSKRALRKSRIPSWLLSKTKEIGRPVHEGHVLREERHGAFGSR